MNGDYSSLVDPFAGDALSFRGDHFVNKSGATYPIIRGIPRFVGTRHYAKDFAVQWLRFAKTQLDSHTGLPISQERLERCLLGHLARLQGKVVLEAGSGAGRFTELLLRAGTVLHSFDLSEAVEANAENNGQSSNLVLVQADIRHIPFRREYYDYVICLGVLQHTPDPEQSIRNLYRMVKPGGYLVFDHYLWKWRNILPPPIGTASILYRWLIKRLPHQMRFKAVKHMVDFWFPLHWRFRESLTAQRLLRRVSPVHFYYGTLDLRERGRYYEWALLDTHDGTTDLYKHYRSLRDIRTALEKLNAEHIAVREAGNGIEALCRKPPDKL